MNPERADSPLPRSVTRALLMPMGPAIPEFSWLGVTISRGAHAHSKSPSNLGSLELGGFRRRRTQPSSIDGYRGEPFLIKLFAAAVSNSALALMKSTYGLSPL